MASNLGNRDIIVVGGSAGSLEPLRAMMSALPADFPAAVFVVVHIGQSSHLAAILDRAGPLPAAPAESGAPVEHGRVYVGVPDRHLLLHDGHVLLCRGPRENMARPAIDPLFRSAAASYGGRVIGVILSGDLNDGTAGLHAIKRCGGTAVVQDPNEAEVPSMPLSASQHVKVDYCLAAPRMGACLVELAAKPAGETPPIPPDVRLETAIAVQEVHGASTAGQLGSLAPLTCPECNGPLWQVADDPLLRYRCHLGHALTAEGVLDGEVQEADRALEYLVRLKRERAELLRRMADKAEINRRCGLAGQLRRRAREYDEQADLLQDMSDRFAAAAGVRSSTEFRGEGQE
jgi:two-component system chemotaxis response regulator CheB